MNKYFVDTDPGVDDALALFMLFQNPLAQVLGLGISAGNVGLDYTTANALKILDVVAQDVPVFRGCSQPLVHIPHDAAFVHGRDGFGDAGYLPSLRKPTTEHAAQALIRLSYEYPQQMVLIALGPLTNIALALVLDPSLPQRIRRLVVMGGAVSAQGNIQHIPVEFNIGFDPEAAHIVFSRWPQFDLVDWQATLAHGIAFSKIQQCLELDCKRAQFYAAISRKTQEFMKNTPYRGQWQAADALAMAAALEPECAQWEDRPVWIELSGLHTRGMTVVDESQRSGRHANARILRNFDQVRFEELVIQSLTASVIP